jgi:HAD superfamily hydrolase (TIGR01509 family)
MEGIMDLAKEFGLYVIEDNAQAIGAKYTFSDGSVKSTGTIGHIGTTSFFPSKNLGCYGDGGAMFTNDVQIAKNLKIIANHGQEVKYYHKVTGCNSRLDSIQAAILNIKLNHLDSYSLSRNEMAKNYDENFSEIPELSVPKRQYNSTHVFHQYTLKVLPELRNSLIDFLKENNIPIALGSASKNAHPILEKVGLLHYFDTIVDGNNVTKAKPDPEVFLLAAKQLGVKSNDCVVFEDAIAGVKAANAAKMISIGIGDKKVLSEAQFNFNDFTEISTDFIQELINRK